MRIVGVIVEYNPLHNGHIYQLQQIRKTLGNDSVIIALMSGNVVQRGEFSIDSKFSRASKAVDHGTNIVIEIPTEIVLNSAEYFTKGTVEIINRFGITDLVFGSDVDDINYLKELSKKINSDEFKAEVKVEIKNTQSFPSAVEKVLGIRLSSNDILATSYINSAFITNPNIEVHAIKRVRNESITSATSIRKLIIEHESHTNYADEVSSSINMDDYVKSFKFVIHSSEDDNPFITYIKKNIINEEQSWDEMLSSLANKSFTKKFIARKLMKKVLNIKEKKFDKVRLLAFDSEGSKYLSNFKDVVYSKYNKELDTELRVAKLIDSISDTNYTKQETQNQIIKK